MKVTQVKLENVGHPEYMVCWLPSPKKIKVGTVYSLVDVLGLWKVIAVYTTQDHFEINRGWNNNI